MKLKTVLILIAACILLAAIGLGIEDIYCSYFSGVPGLRQYALVDEENGAVISYYRDDLNNIDPAYVNGLADWAAEHGAALVVMELESRGHAVFDGSGRLMKYLNAAGVPEGSPPMDGGMRGVYVANDPAFIEAYTADGVLMPGDMDLPVLGYYDLEKMPRNLRPSYIYPLRVSGGHGEFFLTDAEEGIDGLTELILENNEGKAVNRVNDYGGALGFISLLFNDPMAARSRSRTFYTIAAVSISFVFSGLMLFREYGRELEIRRRFGMSKGRILRNVLFIAFAVFMASLLLFAAGMERLDLIKLDTCEKLLITGVLAAVSAVLETVIILFGMAGAARKRERRKAV